MTVAAMPMNRTINMPDRDRGERESPRVEFERRERIEKLPKKSELDRALENATTETLLEVRQGFVLKAFEQAFEDYPDDFSLEKCKLMPKNSTEGLRHVEKDGKVSVYAEKFLGEDGKTYGQFWIDLGNPNPEENIITAVVCELDNEGKPILNSNPNENKAVIKTMSENEFNASLKTKDELPSDRENYWKIKPKFWKVAVFGIPGLLIPEKAERIKDPVSYQSELNAYAIGQLVKGNVTPEQYNKLTSAKDEAKRRDRENTSLRNERDTAERLNDLRDRREMLGFEISLLERRRGLDQQAVINDAEDEIEQDENLANLENLIRTLSGRKTLLGENYINLIARTYNIDVSEIKGLRDKVEEEKGLSDIRAIQELVSESEGNFEDFEELREVALGKIIRFRDEYPDLSVAEEMDRFYSGVYTILTLDFNQEDEEVRNKLFLLREQLIADLKVENQPDIAQALEETELNITPIIIRDIDTGGENDGEGEEEEDNTTVGQPQADEEGEEEGVEEEETDEEKLVSEINWILNRVLTRAEDEGKSGMTIFKGYGGYINDVWAEYGEILEQRGITSKTQFQKVISDLIKAGETNFS